MNNYLLKYKVTLNRLIINDLINYLIIGIIAGGRLGYVLFYNVDFYL